MIYDAFTFYNELDLLELRLRLLDEVVDTFVLCEAPFTFRGAPKPLFFAEHAERFARWRDRIIPLVYPGPSDPDPWRNEWGQRDYLARAFAACAPDDVILIGDCDEIPDPRNVARQPAPGNILVHLQCFSNGYFNRASAKPWFGTRALAANDLPHFGTVTAVRGYPTAGLETVEGGWHFHALGGAAVAEAGMRAKSHSELDVTYYRDPLRLADEYAGERDWRWVPFDASFPPLLHDERWSAFVWERPAPGSIAGTPLLAHAHGCFGYVPPDAAAVHAVAAGDLAVWEAAGRTRFGDRFAGATSTLQDCIASLSSAAWVVIDGLERQDTRSLELLRASAAGVVAYAGNACSREVFDAVIDGAPYPPGRALGATELPVWIRSLGWEIGSVDRIAVRGVFAVFAQMPQQLSVENGRFTFANISREMLSDFLAKAFIFTLPPQRERSAEEARLSETVRMTLTTVTVCDVELPRWMTPFAQHLFSIPTHLTLQERLMLFQSAFGLPANFTAVEIGSYIGASTAFLAYAALQRGGNVHAIDPWENDAMGAEGHRDTWGEFRTNTSSFQHYIVPHRGTSSAIAARDGAIPCDMLFIDGDHSYAAVLNDLRTWLPSLRPGGLLAMHDIDTPSVKQAFDEVFPAAAAGKPPQIVDRLLLWHPP